MKVCYLTSMFPCWSETFILNEMCSHHSAGVDICVYSIKEFTEVLMHAEAADFLALTKYPNRIFSLTNIKTHIELFAAQSRKYLEVLKKLLSIRVTEFKMKAKLLALFMLSAKFVLDAKNSDIDHFHAHFATYPSVLAWIISEFTGKPYTLTAHAHDIYVNQDLLPLVCRNASLIFAISNYNRSFIKNVLGEEEGGKTIVLHCGIDLAKYPFKAKCGYFRDKNTELRILSIGRLTGIKGFEYLLDALAIIKKKRLNFLCEIIGGGPLELKLKAQAGKLSLGDNVRFLGARKMEEIIDCFHQSDLFILACAKDRLEGQDGIPVVFMEAMACGIPVIGTRISGIPELVIDGRTGLCAKAMNAESLANKILYFYEHPEEIESMRLHARSVIERDYNIEKITEQQRQNFRTIMERSETV